MLCFELCHWCWTWSEVQSDFRLMMSCRKFYEEGCVFCKQIAPRSKLCLWYIPSHTPTQVQFYAKCPQFTFWANGGASYHLKFKIALFIIANIYHMCCNFHQNVGQIGQTDIMGIGSKQLSWHFLSVWLKLLFPVLLTTKFWQYLLITHRIRI